MAEDNDDSNKTEEPTQKRLDDAHKRGEVASSREINHWFMIGTAALVTLSFGPGMIAEIGRLLTVFVEAPHAIKTDPAGIQSWLADLLGDLGLTLMPAFGLLLIAAFASAFLQVGPLFTAEQLQPKFSKISPMRGIKRMFSLQALIELAKSIVKLAIVGAVAWKILRPEFDQVERFVDYDMYALLAELNTLMLKLLGGIVAIVAAIAALDFFYQKLSHRRRLRMTREEVRDEFKDTEGDPMIKSRLRQIRMERSKRRMMQAVPTADVVITNPTHYAVALKYDQNTMAAPVVVAKGVDLVAKRIRELAEENKVPIVENPPLARALYAGVNIDAEIQPEHYRAVAEVISYVMKLRRERRWSRR